ncbi:MAG: hypothetical protein COY19_05195 [Candidatus Marinimicrobia bacterium CG_4_10_14_0_2_um_filter_48_9]|nr:MAG: hypothetical protein COY19_05195 [Candidatus Marinimicrobia bacterium CG_4_10_14_0_2_um_filter_48_9]
MFRHIIPILFIVVTASASDYIWPIKATPFLSATFCEYREGHFHSGIDVKTWGEMDVPCVAIADGYIEKITAGYRGYGKVIFLMLDDGNRIVYAHLDYFAPYLEKKIRQAQVASKRYAVDVHFKPNEFRVEQGNLIAYTGVSGTQFPHLHFEIRDPTNVPVNPLAFYNDLLDTMAPRMKHLAVVPLTPFSTVNNSYLPYFFDLPVATHRAQSLPTPIYVSGTFGLEISGFDVANGTQNKYSIYKTDLWLDDSLAFQMTYNAAPFETTNLVGQLRPLYRDYPDWRFTRLYRNKALEKLRFFAPGLDGRIQLSPGIHIWRLTLEDFHQNQTTISGILISQLPSTRHWVSTTTFDSVYSFTRFGSNDYAFEPHFFQLPKLEILAHTTLYASNSTTWEFNFPGGVESGVLGEIVDNEHKTEIFHLVQPRNQEKPALEYAWVPTGYGEILQLRTSKAFVFPNTIRLIGRRDSLELVLEILSDKLAESHPVTVAQKLTFDRFQLAINPASNASYRFQQWQWLGRNDSVNLTLLDGALEVQLHTDSSTTAAYFQVDTLAHKFENQLWPGFRIQQPEGSAPVSGKFKFHVGTGKSSEWQLYKRKGRQVEFLKSTAVGTWLSGPVKGSGDYLLLSDNIPPKLVPILSKTTFKPGDKLLFSVQDNLQERAIAVRIQSATLNESRIYPDYNPMRQELSYWILPDTPAGDYTLIVTLADQGGNRSDNRFQFKVR